MKTRRSKYIKEYWKNFNERYKALTAEELIALYCAISREETTRQCLSTLMNVKNVTN